MTKRMLIDATDPAEIRVVVLNRSRVEEFDHEIRSRAQLKGNIYLAKVTRVEPSLQAAFVDYGGNRHGFLPFSEIHPDYYRIPVADREALLAEEAALKLVEEDERDRHLETSGDADGEPVFVEEVEDAAEPLEETGQSHPEAPASAEHPAGWSEAAGPADDDDGSAPAAPEDEEPAEEAPTDDENRGGGRSQPHVAAGGEKMVGEPAEDGDAEADEADADTAHAEDMAAGEEEADAAAPDRAEEAAAPDDGAPDGEPSEGGPAAGGAKPSRPAVEELETEQQIDTVGGDEIEDAARRRAKLLRRYKIQEVVKRGQVMLVQVAKEERGNKGAALTTYLSLPGRFCVLMPNTARGGGISRKIGSAADRRRLKQVLGDLSIPDGMAVIVRTAGSERSKAEIKRDYEYLLRLWSEIRETTLSSQAPALIYEEGNLIKRAIRDLYTSDTEEILVEGEEAYKAAKAFMKSLMPSHARKVQLYKDPAVPLFLKHQVESQLGAMFDTTVQLRSGGYIVINVTEALVAIDVNSGKATRERHIEETALKTNLEAADEVARQLRLRDLAGLIVIDFIDMEESRHNRDVERRLKEAMKADRARIQLGRISPFGLLELSRQRLRPSLVETAMITCPHCQGAGRVFSAETAALHLLRSLGEEGMRRPGGEVNIAVGSRVALYLLNQKRVQLSEIEQRYSFVLQIDVDERLHGLDHRLERPGAREGRGERDRGRERGERDRRGRDRRDERGERREEPREEPREEEVPEVVEAEEQPARQERGDRRPRREERREDRRGGDRRRDRDRDRGQQRRAPEPVLEAAAPAEEAPLDASEAESAPAPGAGEDEESRARRRRRRGKRGGRRRGRRREDQPDSGQEAASGQREAAFDSSTGDDIEDHDHPDEEAQNESARENDASDDDPQEAATPELAPEPRTQPTGAAAAEPASPPAEPRSFNGGGQPSDEAEPHEQRQEEASDETDPNQPKRRGWWNRLVR